MSVVPVLVAGNSVNMEGAVPTEQEINQPKPSKRARTSFTADQLQVNLHHHLLDSLIDGMKTVLLDHFW